MKFGLALFAVLACACIEPSYVDCRDGTICPIGHTCVPGGCVGADLLAACTDLADGDACSVGGEVGTCVQRTCVVASCGDEVIGPGEVCDDGNRAGGDGCSATCTSTEECGNGIVDLAEACDCGDAAQPGSSACMGTFNDGPICSAQCELRGCGNGVLDPGEACDDGSTVSGDGCRADCAKVELCGDNLTDVGEGCDDGNTNAADGCDACTRTFWRATSLVGGNTVATSISLSSPSGIAMDRAGALYVVDTGNHRIRRIDPGTGIITTVAGTGIAGFSGDGGPAANAQLSSPGGVAIDGLGTLYVADSYNSRIRRIDATTGVITTIAGASTNGYSGDGGPATSARLNVPWGIAVDGLGTVYVSDWQNHRIRKIDGATGIITTIAGTGDWGYSGDDGAATSAELWFPRGIALDGTDALLVADESNNRVRRIDLATGFITTVAGDGVGGGGGDGGLATAAGISVAGIAVDAQHDLYITGNGSVVRRVDGTTGIIETITGTGIPGYSGDGGPAIDAMIAAPHAVTVGSDDTVYLADTSNHRVRRIDGATGVITSIAGLGTGGLADGGAATSTKLGTPYQAAVDAMGNVYIVDTGTYRVQRLDAATGTLTNFAGTGVQGYSGDGGAATSAQLNSATGVAIDASGAIYIADGYNRRIRRVDPVTRIITTVAGSGVLGDSGDQGLATNAQLKTPGGIAFDTLGALYIVDGPAHRVRRVDPTTQIITTVAGTGVSGFSGDGDLATSAQLSSPTGVVVDAVGTLYISDSGNQRIRKVHATTKIITTIAGDGTQGSTGDDGPAVDARLRNPVGVALDATGSLLIGDSDNYRVRRIDATTDIITTICGDGVYGFGGDGGLASNARCGRPFGVTVDGQGNIYIADTANDLVRRIGATTDVITTIAGSIDPEGMGPVAVGRLADPRALVVSPGLTVVAGGLSGIVQTVGAAIQVVAGRYPQPVAIGDLARYRAQSFGTVGGVAYDAANGRIYLTESNAHRLHVVTIVDPANPRTWTIAPLAGDQVGAGSAGFADGAASAARFRAPSGLYLDTTAQLLYVADTGNHVIRAIDLTAGVSGATVQTVAGTPATLGYFGDGGAASAALLHLPQALTRCANGDLFIADTGNNRIRRIASQAGTISTVLGVGLAASFGEGTPSTAFPIHAPLGLACDATGNLFATSTQTIRMLPANVSGVVDGTGPVHTIYGASTATFPASVTRCLTGIAVVDATTLEVTDSCTGLLVQLHREPVP